MIRWIKYGTQSDIRFTMVKRGSVDLAVTGDWTPAAADSAISKDGGNFADTTNTVAVVGGSPTRGVVGWKLTISSTEAQAKELQIQIVDAATKAVEDQFLTVYTWGNASAKFAGDWEDLVRLGLTALPNANAEAAGGLYTRGSGAGQIAQDANGRISTNLVAILGTTLTETAGQIAAGFKKLFDVASPVFTLLSVNQTGDSYARIGAPAGASVSADIAAAKTVVDAIKTKTDSLTFTVANEVNANARYIDGSSAAATKAKKGFLLEVAGTCDAGSSTTSIVASAVDPASAVNDQFNSRIMIFEDDTTTAALRGQATDITDYDHATLTFTVTALTTAPSSGDKFRIV